MCAETGSLKCNPERKQAWCFHRAILMPLILGLAICGDACDSRTDSKRPHAGNAQKNTRPIFYPKSMGPSPAIIVLPQAGSLISSQADDVARRLAEQGYVAQAVSYGERTSGRILADQDGTNRIKHVISECLTNLRHQPKVGADRIGIVCFSLGGAFAIHFASSAEENGLRAVVIYYGVYRYPELMPNLKAPVLAFQEEADSYRDFIANAFDMQRIALDRHKQFDVITYKDAKHGFDYRSSSAFNPSAAQDSWNRTIVFFDKYLKH
jgi:carboxymethylenebutenolidase